MSFIPLNVFTQTKTQACKCPKHVNWNCPCMQHPKYKLAVTDSCDEIPKCKCYTLNLACPDHGYVSGVQSPIEGYNGYLSGYLINKHYGVNYYQNNVAYSNEDVLDKHKFVPAKKTFVVNEKQFVNHACKQEMLNPPQKDYPCQACGIYCLSVSRYNTDFCRKNDRCDYCKQKVRLCQCFCRYCQQAHSLIQCPYIRQRKQQYIMRHQEYVKLLWESQYGWRRATKPLSQKQINKPFKPFPYQFKEYQSQKILKTYKRKVKSVQKISNYYKQNNHYDFRGFPLEGCNMIDTKSFKKYKTQDCSCYIKQKQLCLYDEYSIIGYKIQGFEVNKSVILNQRCKDHKRWIEADCHLHLHNHRVRGTMRGIHLNAIINRQDCFFPYDFEVHDLASLITQNIRQITYSQNTISKIYYTSKKQLELEKADDDTVKIDTQGVPLSLFKLTKFKCHQRYQLVGSLVFYEAATNQDIRNHSVKSFTKINRTPKTLRELIANNRQQPYQGKGQITKAQFVRTGDYVQIDGDDFIFEAVRSQPERYNDEFGAYKKLQKPKKTNMLYDVQLPVIKDKKLYRPSQKDYQDVAKDIIYHKSKKIYTAHILQCQMGWGKTTRFPFVLNKLLREKIYITLPSIVLVQKLYQDLLKISKQSKIKVGKKCQGKTIDGQIIVQTPAYLISNVWNIIDEFQFLTEHNKAFIQTFDNYKGKTILSSATIYGPLLATLQNNRDFDVNIVSGHHVREIPRFLIWSDEKFDVSRTPLKSICFTTQSFNHQAYPDQPFPSQYKINSSVEGSIQTLLVHPNMVFGFNPPFQVNLGFICFKRMSMLPTSQHGIYQMQDPLPVEYQNVFQALGRLSRNSDNNAWLFIYGTAFYSPLRFKRPIPPSVGVRQLKFIEEAYNAKTKAPKVFKDSGDSGYHNTLININHIANQKPSISIGKNKFYFDEPVQKKYKSCYGVMLIRNKVTAQYFSTFVSSRVIQSIQRCPLIDCTSGLAVQNKANPHLQPTGTSPIYKLRAFFSSRNETIKSLYNKGIPIAPFLQKLEKWAKEGFQPLNKGYFDTTSAISYEIQKAYQFCEIDDKSVHIRCNKNIKAGQITEKYKSKINGSVQIINLDQYQPKAKTIYIIQDEHEKVINKFSGKEVIVNLFRSGGKQFAVIRYRDLLSNTVYSANYGHFQSLIWKLFNPEQILSLGLMQSKIKVNASYIKQDWVQIAKDIIRTTINTQDHKNLVPMLEKIQYHQGMLQTAKMGIYPSFKELLSFQSYITQKYILLCQTIPKPLTPSQLSECCTIPIKCDNSMTCPMAIAFSYLDGVNETIANQYKKYLSKCNHVVDLSIRPSILIATPNLKNFIVSKKALLMCPVESLRILQQININAMKKETYSDLIYVTVQPVYRSRTVTNKNGALIQEYQKLIHDEEYQAYFPIKKNFFADYINGFTQTTYKNQVVFNKCFDYKDYDQGSLYTRTQVINFISRLQQSKDDKRQIISDQLIDSKESYGLGLQNHQDTLIPLELNHVKSFILKRNVNRIDRINYYQFFPLRSCSCEIQLNQFFLKVQSQLPGRCAKCFVCPELPQKTNHWREIINDIKLILKGGFRNQQQTKTQLISYLKTFIQRKEKFSELRKFIHYSGQEQTDLHKQFNQYCHLVDANPADIWLILGFASALINTGAYLYSFYQRQSHYEDVIKKNPIISSHQADTYYSTPNVTQNDNFIVAEVSNCPEDVTRQIHNGYFKDLFVTKSAQVLEDRHKNLELSSAKYKGDAGHLICNQARQIATAQIKQCLTTAYVQLGSRKADLTSRSPVLMVSNRFDKTFKSCNAQSKGIYASYNLEHFHTFENTAQEFMDIHNPKSIVARDSLHNPRSYQFFLKVLTSNRNPIQTGYIIGHFILGQPGQKSITGRDVAYKISPSSTKNWSILNTMMNGQRPYTQLTPNLYQLTRICASKNLLVQFHPTKIQSYITYGYAVITRGDKSAYNRPNTFINIIGDYVYNQKGLVGKNLTQLEKQIYTTTTETQKISLRTAGRDTGQSGLVKSQSKNLYRKKNWFNRIAHKYLSGEDNADYSQRSITNLISDKLMKNILTKVQGTLIEELSASLILKEHQIVQVSVQNCGLKYHLINSKFENGQFNSCTLPLNTTTTQHPYLYSVNGGLTRHAVFIGENDAEENRHYPGQNINGRTFKVTRQLRKLYNNLTYQIIPIKLVQTHTEPHYQHYIESDISNAPCSQHISKNKYMKAVNKGYNKTVLNTMTLTLGGVTVSLPQLPTYESLVQFCTCTMKTRPVFQAECIKNGIKMHVRTVETCPINAIYSVVFRQGCARVNPDPQIMKEFIDFSDRWNQYIIDQMLAQNFKVDFSAEQINQYLQHIKQKDPWKQKKIKQNFSRKINKNQSFSSFVKIGQKHVVYTNQFNGQSTADSLDPRFISSPSYTIRGRVGLIAYFVLKFLKKLFPEFLLAKTSQQLEIEVSKLAQHPFTSQADWSKFDATQSAILRTAVDRSFFQNMYSSGIIKLFNQTDDDRHFASVIDVKFDTNIKLGKQTVFNCKCKIHGTTFSGHPTCTTCGGTLRNFYYNTFAMQRRYQMFTFSTLVHQLPLYEYISFDGSRYMARRPKDLISVYRMFTTLKVCGDDTAKLCQKKQDRDAWDDAVSQICHNQHQTLIKGLGLVIKAPKKDYKRFGILSKHFALYNQTPVVLRQIPRLILTNTSASQQLSDSQVQMLAGLQYFSYSMDPLSEKLAQLRLKRVKSQINEGHVYRKFINDRCYKLGIFRKYTHEQAAFTYNISVQQYKQIIDSLRFEGRILYLDMSIIKDQDFGYARYGYGLFSNTLRKTDVEYIQRPLTKQLFKSPNTIILKKKQQDWFGFFTRPKINIAQTRAIVKGIVLSLNNESRGFKTECFLKKLKKRDKVSNQLVKQSIFTKTSSTRQTIKTQLQRGCIQSNPGPGPHYYVPLQSNKIPPLLSTISQNAITCQLISDDQENQKPPHG